MTKRNPRRSARRRANARYANAKALFNSVNHLSMESQLQMEAERMADSMLTEDHVEGIKAFTEKRKPVQGRLTGASLATQGGC